MFGDMVLWIKKLIKEMFCIHDYKYVSYLSFTKECTKCGREKK